MSKSYRIVKEFEFPSDKGFSGSSGKVMVKGYARGGAVCAGAKKAVHKHEAKMHPGEAITKMAHGGAVKGKRGVPVSPPAPLIGNKTPNAFAAKRDTNPGNKGGTGMAGQRVKAARGPAF